MGKHDRLMQRLLSGRADANIPFKDLLNLLHAMGFYLRIRGDHHILFHDRIPDILNLQPVKNKAKPYQVKQVRNLILQHKLGPNDDDQV